MFIIFLVAIGLCLGSFVNALVWRLWMQGRQPEVNKAKSKKAKLETQVSGLGANDLSIAKGRSMCPRCKHKLHWNDLVPVLSWLRLGGKCRYCKKSISTQYPAVELLTVLLFVASYVFWPNSLSSILSIVYFLLWLGLLTVLVALAVYDVKWMILPNSLVFAAGLIVLAMTLLQLFTTKDISVVGGAIFGLLAFGGVFYILFQISAGKWIGGGDVKLGFVLGALLAGPVLSFLAIFLASLIGSFIAGILLVVKKLNLKTKIPFGPLLIIGTVIAYFFGDKMLALYTQFVLGI